MDVPPVPAPPVPAAPLPRVPRPPSVGEGGFAGRLLVAAAATGDDDGAATLAASATSTAPPRAATAADRAVTLGAMLAARTGGVSATSTLTGIRPPTAALVRSGPFAGHHTVVAPTSGRISSDFGMRIHPITGQYRHHDGMDVAAPTGTPVRAVTDGVVVATGSRGGYGLTVDVDHGNGTTTRYAHLSAIDVAVGQTVGAGAQLGDVGSTGRSTGPHLHVEVRVDGEPVDPAGLW